MDVPARAKREVILYVDDEPQALKYFSKLLSDEFEIVTAGSAAEGMQLIERDPERFAVVISDQRMPMQVGTSFLAEVREKYPNIVRMVTTAYSELNDAIEAVNLGEVYRYILKPWSLLTLRQDLRSAVEIFQLRRERDLLLQEKLGVHRSLRGVQRSKALLALVCSLLDERAALAGTCAYIKDATRLARSMEISTHFSESEFWTEAEFEISVFSRLGLELAALSSLPARSAIPSIDVQALDLQSVLANGAAEIFADWKAAAEKREPAALIYLFLAGVRTYSGDGPVSVQISGQENASSISVTLSAGIAEHSLLFCNPSKEFSTAQLALPLAYVLAHREQCRITAALDGDKLTLTLGPSIAERPSDSAHDLVRRTLEAFELWD